MIWKPMIYTDMKGIQCMWYYWNDEMILIENIVCEGKWEIYNDEGRVIWYY